MTGFDIFVAIVLGLSLVYSVLKGLVREIFSLLALVGGFLMAVKFQEPLARVLEEPVSNDTVAGLLAFAAVFFATLVAVSLIGQAVQKFVHRRAGLSGLDRILGGAIGVLKGVLLLIIFMVPLKFFPNLYGEWTRDSWFAPRLETASEVLRRTVQSPRLLDSVPQISLEGMKKNLGKLQDLDSVARDFGTPKPESEAAEGLPQEEYTQEDKKKLHDILLSLEEE